MNLFDYTYNLVRQIPKGRVSTYGAIATALGDILAARAVGRMMNQNPNADTMPCFKIVYHDGSLGGFGLGIKDKIRRLKQDGISINNGKIDDFDNIVFKDFKTNYPLHNLQKEQKDKSKEINLKDEFSESIQSVAGIDVAYPKNEFEPATVAYIALDYNSYTLLEQQVVFAQSIFPYIPGYLTYREFPLIQEILKKINTKPSVLMIDGNGILHPRKCGIACMVGLTFNIPTIGVAKNKLIGEERNNRVYVDGETRAFCLKSGHAQKPIYISSGHQISLEQAYEITKHMSTYKNPEPLRLAHRIARNYQSDKR